MSEAFLGQITTYGFNFAVRNWAFCAGQTMAINQQQALFALLGTVYGGNGTVNFGLPDLRSRTMVGANLTGGAVAPGATSYAMGATGGSETATLTSAMLPSHTHIAQVNNLAVSGSEQLQVSFTNAALQVTCNLTASKDPATSDAPLQGGMLADVAPNTTKVYGASSTNTATLAPISATGTFSASANMTASSLNLSLPNTPLPVQVSPQGSPNPQISILTPFVAVNHLICISGIFPSRD